MRTGRKECIIPHTLTGFVFSTENCPLAAPSMFFPAEKMPVSCPHLKSNWKKGAEKWGGALNPHPPTHPFAPYSGMQPLETVFSF